MKTFLRFARDESGATAIEYVMIAGLISIFVLAGVTAAGTGLFARFTDVSRAMP